jgi:hypothetical protein
MRTRLFSTLLAGMVVTAVATVATVAPAAAAPTKKGQTVVTLSAAAGDLLEELKVAVGTTGPAYPSGSGIAFPVVGRTGDAVIQHVGGLSFTAGETTVTIENFWIDTDSGVVTGIVDDTVRVPLFTLGAETDDGLELKLTMVAADYLNGAFDVEDFSKGLVIGYGAPAETV